MNSFEQLTYKKYASIELNQLYWQKLNIWQILIFIFLYKINFNFLYINKLKSIFILISLNNYWISEFLIKL
jgi:hypothetical protein